MPLFKRLQKVFEAVGVHPPVNVGDGMVYNRMGVVLSESGIRRSASV